LIRTQKYEWHKIAESDADIQSDGINIKVVELNGKRICLTKFNDSWFAFAGVCPHAGGLLSEGYIDMIGNVVCPLHQYKFNIKNGKNVSGEGYTLRTYPIELRPDGIFIGLEESGLLGWS
jgi:3-phenylpropionate/trans-cinnamate dioxygenase ferredoxin subunit